MFGFRSHWDNRLRFSALNFDLFEQWQPWVKPQAVFYLHAIQIIEYISLYEMQ